MALRDKLARALKDGHASDMDHVMADERDIVQDIDRLRDAAVLIAITDRPEPGVILVQRPDYMRNHPGQIAFPGGKIDPGDEDAVAAALREANEEVALDPAHVDVIGPTDRYHSGSGFNIQPILAVIPPDLPLVACPEEVREWFEVPLDFVMNPENATAHVGEWRGIRREYYEMPWQGRRIWGITAGILVNLSTRLRWGS
ncbi:CoA pyrophosphatase [Parasphingorhabdus halotolerans]|uniref:CoA pyrophosphatase n=1 Tax=Parasphingorhabdus halotolerans TaxID=2725558 RepID=A0A6H2DRL3_9SPHN|nr:CoA pyrophosphatase [Parasphingorhabdus halotolerans]QJB70767.1 CoA pyrophosphatase [Parasphingorhabdus halotolerans]